MTHAEELNLLATDTVGLLSERTVAITLRDAGTLNASTRSRTAGSKVLTVSAVKSEERPQGAFGGGGGGGGGAGGEVDQELVCEYVVNAADLAAATATGISGTAPTRTDPRHGDRLSDTDPAGGTKVWDVVSVRPQVGGRQFKLWCTRKRSGT